MRSVAILPGPMVFSDYSVGDYVRFLKKIGPGLAGSVGEVRLVNAHGLSVRIAYNHLGRPFNFTVSAQPFENFEPVSDEDLKRLQSAEES